MALRLVQNSILDLFLAHENQHGHGEAIDYIVLFVLQILSESAMPNLDLNQNSNHWFTHLAKAP